MILSLEEKVLQTEGDHFIADTAVVIGSVRLKHEASVWWGAVLRGDFDTITVGERTNVQDNAVVHMDEGYPVTLGVESRWATKRCCTVAPWATTA